MDDDGGSRGDDIAFAESKCFFSFLSGAGVNWFYPFAHSRLHNKAIVFLFPARIALDRAVRHELPIDGAPPPSSAFCESINNIVIRQTPLAEFSHPANRHPANVFSRAEEGKKKKKKAKRERGREKEKNLFSRDGEII